VSGHTWGGCIEIIQWILTAGRFPTDPAVLDGGVLILEASEEIIPAQEFGWILRSLGERGLLTAADAVLVARPPASSFDKHPSAQKRAVHRAEQRDVAIDVVSRYNPDAVVCVGVPFGHTRPQWILPSAETSPLMAPSSGSGPITGRRDPHICRRARPRALQLTALVERLAQMMDTPAPLAVTRRNVAAARLSLPRKRIGGLRSSVGVEKWPRLALG